MMDIPSEVRGKVIIITGASSGIGEATALLLAERGAHVVLGARGLDRLEALAVRIAQAGGEAAYARTDVKKRADLSSLVALACERYGRLDVLVNNAGLGPLAPLDDLRVEEWEDMIDVNIKGVLYGIAAALPIFVGREAGTLSTSLPRRHIASCRTWPSTAARSSPCAPSPRGCARRRATPCA